MVTKIEYLVSIASSDSVDNYFSNKYIIFLEENRIKEEGLWSHGIFIGPYKTYYKNGNLAAEGSFDEQGQYDGCWKYYKKNGTLKRTERFNP